MEVILDKGLQNHWIFQDAEKLKWWVDLHFMADDEGKICMSLNDLAHRWKTERTKVSRFLAKVSAAPIGATLVQHQVQQITLIRIGSYKEACNTECNTCATPQEKVSSSFSPIPPLSSSLKDINNSIDNNAPTRERIPWEDWKEFGFCEQFKAEGRLMASAKKLGCDAYGISAYLEKFMAHCQSSDLGHTNIGHFGSHFNKFVETEKTKPLQPKRDGQSVVDYNQQIAMDLGLI